MDVKAAIPISFGLCLALILPARADVQIIQLRGHNLTAEIPNWQEHGILPGDVLLRNDELSAVVLTTAGNIGKESRVGRCVMLPRSAADSATVTYGPGPSNIWNKAEVARTASLVAVRFRHVESNWSAELLYKLRDHATEVETSTVLHNASDDATLVVPMVDDLRLVGAAQQDAYGVVQMTRTDKSVLASLSPVDVRVSLRGMESDRWAIGFISGDPSPSLVSRVRRTMPAMNKSGKEISPIAVNDDWHRTIRDSKNYYRIAPGSTRTITRHFIGSSGTIVPPSLASMPSKKLTVETASTADSSNHLKPITEMSGKKKSSETTREPSRNRLFSRLRGAFPGKSSDDSKPREPEEIVDIPTDVAAGPVHSEVAGDAEEDDNVVPEAEVRSLPIQMPAGAPVQSALRAPVEMTAEVVVPLEAPTVDPSAALMPVPVRAESSRKPAFHEAEAFPDMLSPVITPVDGPVVVPESRNVKPASSMAPISRSSVNMTPTWPTPKSNPVKEPVKEPAGVILPNVIESDLLGIEALPVPE